MTARKGFYADVRSLRSQVDLLTDRPYIAVSPQHGSDSANTGESFTSPFATMSKALSVVVSNQDIFVTGDVREQLLAPLGIYGVRIIGVASGRPRHTTSGGVVLDGNGVAWREPASPAATPLLWLREQGWELHNLLMVPRTGEPAVQLHRVEDATYPDASHFVMKGCKIISSGSQVGYGIEDVGGAYHITVEDCEFWNLEFAWKQTSVGIDSPTSHVWRRNQFAGNKTDIALNAKSCRFEGNVFQSPYDVTTHPTTLNLALTADAGVATAKNMVIDNLFADNAADVTIAKGYKPATGDVWRNRVANTAADIVTVPA